MRSWFTPAVGAALTEKEKTLKLLRGATSNPSEPKHERWTQMKNRVLKSCSFQHVLDRAVALAFYTDGYKVVAVRPNAVVLQKGDTQIEVIS